MVACTECKREVYDRLICRNGWCLTCCEQAPVCRTPEQMPF